MSSLYKKVILICLQKTAIKKDNIKKKQKHKKINIIITNTKKPYFICKLKIFITTFFRESKQYLFLRKVFIRLRNMFVVFLSKIFI